MRRLTRKEQRCPGESPQQQLAACSRAEISLSLGFLICKVGVKTYLAGHHIKQDHVWKSFSTMHGTQEVFIHRCYYFPILCLHRVRAIIMLFIVGLFVLDIWWLPSMFPHSLLISGKRTKAHTFLHLQDIPFLPPWWVLQHYLGTRRVPPSKAG